MRRVLQLPDTVLVLPGPVSEPVHFDGGPLATVTGGFRWSVALAGLAQDEYVSAVLARVPPSPPNHERIVELNERGELVDDRLELEAGANRCAVA